MSEYVGMITFRLEGNTPSLTFTGPELPVVGAHPAFEIRYNPTNRRVEFRAGGSRGSETFTVDLANLPEEFRRLINNRGQNRKAQISLPVPGCDAIRDGSGFLSYEQYMQQVRNAQAVQPRPAGAPVNLLDPAMLRAAAAAVVYPPLPRAAYESLVARCRGSQLFGGFNTR